MRITKYLAAAALAFACTAASAQEEAEEPENGFSVSADFVSSYAWRGGYCAGASFQPTISYTVGGFTFGTWATSTIKGGDDYTEIDWSAFYTAGGFSVGVTDYSWTMDKGFVYFDPYKESHFLEATLAYELLNVPLSFSVNTMLAGANRTADDEAGLSTYINAIYAPSLSNGIDLSLEAGFAIEKDEAAMYSSKGGFQCVNLALGLSKTFPVKDLAEITVSAGTYCNPKGFDGHGQVGASVGVGIAF